MAFINASFFSPVLGKEVGMHVIMPETGRGPFPVLYLLHGLSDDHSTWHRRTRIEYYVHQLPLIVAMPDGFRGFYTDNNEGPAYGRYMMEDVIGFVERTFPAMRKRGGRCIGGLSMGGYGALRLALAHPNMFASAHSHSGAFAASTVTYKNFWRESERYRTFGPHPKGSAHDVFALARKLKSGGKRIPQLRIDCGEQDTLIGCNRELHAHLNRLKIRHEYIECPGEHNWDFWDKRIRGALVFHRHALKIRSKIRRP